MRASVATGWNLSIDRNARRVNKLEHLLVGKAEPFSVLEIGWIRCLGHGNLQGSAQSLRERPWSLFRVFTNSKRWEHAGGAIVILCDL